MYTHIFQNEKWANAPNEITAGPSRKWVQKTQKWAKPIYDRIVDLGQVGHRPKNLILFPLLSSFAYYILTFLFRENCIQ